MNSNEKEEKYLSYLITILNILFYGTIFYIIMCK
jgi:hypothetical protein